MKPFTLLCTLALTSISACSSQNNPTEILEPTPRFASSVIVYETAKDTDHRLSKLPSVNFSAAQQPLESQRSVFVNLDQRFQTFMGVGGAFTDASAEVFAKLSPDNQQALLEAYYDQEQGIGYSLGRTTIHSSDFGSKSYTYIDEGDKDLTSFSIAPDLKYRIPLIKRAIEAAGGELTMYASPWSAPAFMKDTNNMLQGGSLLPEYYQSWANYFVRFIQEYEKQDIPLWGVTIQNEPMAVQRWESMIYTAEQERDFLKYYLGPTMEKAGYADKNIVVWDHNRDLISHRANTIFDDPEAAKYAWGMGFHWYETWAGGETMHDNLANVAQSYPDKKLLFTEGTNELFDPAKYQHWPNAERYGYNMIKDFNAGTVGWTDWNILLDQHGGPNHVENFCFAPIHADLSTDTLIYTPSYYYIGHFSKFVRPGAVRVSTTTSHSDLLATSFINPDQSIATVIMNQSDTPMTFNFIVEDQQASVNIPARAMQTLVY